MADDRREPVWLVPAPARDVVARIEDLEALLRASWSDDVLAIYADQLQLLGDVRGELIALDLAEPSDAAERRRGELLRQWFAGDKVEVWWSEEERVWFAGHRQANTWLMMERGLIEAVHVGDAKSRAALLRLFLESPKSEFLHRLSISGSSTTLRLVLAALTARTRPWLRALAIKRLPDEDRQPLVDGDALVGALPNLASLELDGRRLVDRVDHANLGELVLTGFDAVDLQSTVTWPNVLRLDFALSGGWGPAPLNALITRERFRNLRHLDLSRHERGNVILPQLLNVDLLDQLTHLSLPALQSLQDAGYIQSAINTMPALCELAIARNYMCFGQLAERLHHPSARIKIQTPWPWPPASQVQQLVIGGVEYLAQSLIAALEECYDGLAEPIRAVWFQFWIRLAGDRGSTVYRPELLEALDALALDDPAWIQLRETLREPTTSHVLSVWLV